MFVMVFFDYLVFNILLQNADYRDLSIAAFLFFRDNYSSAVKQHVQQPLPELCI